MGKNDAASHLNHNVTPKRLGEIPKILAARLPSCIQKTADFRKALAKADDPVFQRRQQFSGTDSAYWMP